MNALENTTKMFDAAGVNYSTQKFDKDHTVLVVPVPEQEGRVEVVFTDKGGYFYTSSFKFNDNLRVVHHHFASPSSDDYGLLLKMFDEAPVKMGDVYEAESDDKKYKATIFFEKGQELGVAFVCLASTGKFLAVFGF